MSQRNSLELLERRVRVAMGHEAGDLLLIGGLLVNVFTRTIEPMDVVIADGMIAGVGPYEWDAKEKISVQGQTIIPGLVDAHMHVESSMLVPGELARLIVPRGTSMLVSDPHEIGNVLGIAGIEMLLAASEGLGLDIFFMAPSCVPALSWEDAGATLGTKQIEQLLQHERIIGLAEVMDFPAVLSANRAMLEKVVTAQSRGMAVDGHAPGLVGRDLMAYASAGIRSDHESSTVQEALEKAALGMMVQVREGSSARNLDTLLPLLADNRLGDWSLATDDIHPDDLRDHGHLDHRLQRVVAGGVEAARAVRHATLVPSRHYGFTDRGAVAPGYRADLVVVDDLVEFRARLVIHGGEMVARDGEYLVKQSPSVPGKNTVNFAPLDESSFIYRPKADKCPAIGAIAGQIVTRHETCSVHCKDGQWVFDPKEDVALIACIERHRATGRVGLGLVKGFGFERHGALASTVAHDSHNLIIVGTNAADMLVCAQTLAECGGGLAAAADGQVLAKLPLAVAGLLSSQSADVVCRQLSEVRTAAHKRLGCKLPYPFGTLSFLALPVIPELKITAQGMFDVVKQQFVE